MNAGRITWQWGGVAIRAALISGALLALPAWSQLRLNASLRAERIAILEGETLEQSIAKLCRLKMSRLNVPEEATFGGPGIPIPCSHEIWDIHLVLNNPRFLKVHRELSQLPKDEAARLVASGIDRALTQYEATFDGVVAGHIESCRKAGKPLTMGFGMSNRPDGAPPMCGLRYQLFALVLAAGSLELTDARAAVYRVIAAAAKQRPLLYRDHEEIDERARNSLLYSGSLLNRQVLASGLIGTASNSEAMRLKAAALGVGLIRVALTHYDAERTFNTWDEQVDRRADFSKGKQYVTFAGSLDDDMFRNLTFDYKTGRSPGQIGWMNREYVIFDDGTVRTVALAGPGSLTLVTEGYFREGPEPYIGSITYRVPENESVGDNSPETMARQRQAYTESLEASGMFVEPNNTLVSQTLRSSGELRLTVQFHFAGEEDPVRKILLRVTAGKRTAIPPSLPRVFPIQ